jgi:hypothetical protein
MTELHDRPAGVNRTFHLVSIERLNESLSVGRISCCTPITLERRTVDKDADSFPLEAALRGTKELSDDVAAATEGTA